MVGAVAAVAINLRKAVVLRGENGWRIGNGKQIKNRYLSFKKER